MHDLKARHCEKRSDEAIQTISAETFPDCFAPLAMTTVGMSKVEDYS